VRLICVVVVVVVVCTSFSRFWNTKEAISWNPKQKACSAIFKESHLLRWLSESEMALMMDGKGGIFWLDS
jgi:hypothetical protein